MKTIVVLCTLATAAHADVTRAFPLSAQRVPAPLAHVPALFDAAIARELGAERSEIPIEDAAALLECDVETSRCLDAVAKSTAATRLVFGAVTAQGDELLVSLTRFAPGDREQRTVRIAATTDAARIAELVNAIGPLFDKQPPPVIDHICAAFRGAARPGEAETCERRVEVPVAVDRPAPVERPTRAPRWIAIGSGIAIAGAGAGVLWSAKGMRDQIRSAPIDSREDIDRLVALEARERTRTQLGIGAVAVGGAITAIGVVHAIVSRRTARVAVQPLAGGAAISFTGRLP